ncbi:MAG: hypothetical protein ACFE9S_05565 [Candidatus Hermodarchaeota archaeon]
MSKAVSYYDWELSFKNKSNKRQINPKEEFNSLGISDYNFKNFMKKWKESNLI